MLWMAVAAGLFAFIFFHERYARKTVVEPVRVLPNLEAAAVSSVQVRSGGPATIRADRTNGVWRLTEPLDYPAQAASIEKLLAELERLTPAPYITARELRGRTRTEEEYGFATPQAFITIEQPNYTPRLVVGSRTAPGDQVFLQVVGVEGVYVVDAGFLKYIPHSAADWRDTGLIDLKALTFDRLAVTNGAKIFELRREAANEPWRMVYPLPVRADNAKTEEALQMLQGARVSRFVSDDPKADLTAFGLQPPDLSVALGQGTNTAALLEFGKSPTDDVRLVYARRVGQGGIVTVPKDLLAPWYGSVNDFRDPLLITWTAPVAAVEVRGQDSFSVQQQTNGTWRVLPQGFPADAGLVKDLLTALSTLQIVEFTKDVVIPPDLPAYGLAPPARRYLLESAATNAPGGSTNTIIAELDFGTNQADKVFARRADESFIYAVKLADFQRLPAASWQMRERRIWNLSTNDVASVAVRQQGRVRQIVRNGPFDWSLAPGSPGRINVAAVEETVRDLCQLTAAAWAGQGDQSRTRYGFTDNADSVTLELKNGDKAMIEFSSQANADAPYEAVRLDGQPWIFQLPTWLFDNVRKYLAAPIAP